MKELNIRLAQHLDTIKSIELGLDFLRGQSQFTLPGVLMSIGTWKQSHQSILIKWQIWFELYEKKCSKFPSQQVEDAIRLMHLFITFWRGQCSGRL